MTRSGLDWRPMSGLLEGKRLLITGVLTDDSLAYSVAQMAQEQGAQIAEIGQEIRSSRTAFEQNQHRIEILERQIASLGWWIKGGVSLLVVLAAVAIGILIQILHAH